MPSVDNIVSDLERLLQELESEYNTRRLSYMQAIEVLRGKKPSAGASSANSPSIALNGASARSMAIEEAISALPVTFTTVEVRDYIAQKHPDISKQIKGSYLPTRLKALKGKKIFLIGGGKDGQPNIWGKTSQVRMLEDE